MQTSAIERSLASLTRSQISYIQNVMAGPTIWAPQSQPQWLAYLTPADELFYGGSAGGGKSDLLLGLAITAHQQSIIFRRELTQLTGASGLIERSRDLLQDVARYNGQEHTWRDIPDGRALEFGACQYDQDKRRYQGRPHDFIGFDELTEFLESQYRFLIGWLRTTDSDQRCRVVTTGNPPTHAEGEWVIRYWAPWLDEHHPNPARPGELRWFAVLSGKDVEVDGPEPFEHHGERITPRSRTFIPARLSDNPFLANGPYRALLQGMPEPLRTQLLYGDFSIGVGDDPWQVIPTDWIRQANRRWEEREPPDTPLTGIGVDVARGGPDSTVLSRRYDTWFAPLEDYPGADTPDGKSVGSLVILALVENPEAYVNLDIIGVGTAPYDWLEEREVSVNPINFGAKSDERDRSGLLAMRNVRAAAYWALREALDPKAGDDLALPPDSRLMADLSAPKWKATPSGIQIESKEDIVKRLGRSPDYGDAVVLANYGPNELWIAVL